MKRRFALALGLALVGCATPGGSGHDAAGALANVAVASGVGALRVAEGDCFTLCAPETVCNPKTKLCDPLPCRGHCAGNEVCDQTGPLDRCVKAPGMSVSQTHEVNPNPTVPLGITPPLSSAPPTAPEHPDVPSARP